MYWRDTLREGFASVQGNRLRTILTALIISVGITALIGILTSIDGIKLSLYNNLSILGANSFKIQNKGLTVNVGFGNAGTKAKKYRAIRFEEATEFKSRYKLPAAVSLSTTVSSAAIVKNNDLKTNPNIRVTGGDENYAVSNGCKIVEGRNITSNEAILGSNVVVIGDEIRKKLFPKGLAINSSISIGEGKYHIIGRFESKGSSGGPNTDRFCLISLAKARTISRTAPTYSIVVQVSDALTMTGYIAEATGLFRNIRGLKTSQETNFEITKSDALISQFLGNVTYVTIAATAIGIITLLGASIALMNIMLVSVTERTREIGIRKAVGATSDEIRSQFLIEALLICQLGGIGGIILGITIGNIVSSLVGGGFLIPWVWITRGLLICVVVGISSGIYPAIKASKLDPVEALRYE